MVKGPTLVREHHSDHFPFFFFSRRNYGNYISYLWEWTSVDNTQERPNKARTYNFDFIKKRTSLCPLIFSQCLPVPFYWELVAWNMIHYSCLFIFIQPESRAWSWKLSKITGFLIIKRLTMLESLIPMEPWTGVSSKTC